MRFEHSMRGQTVAINYGTNPMGEVAGVWVELTDGGQADGLTAVEEMAARRLATQHNAQQMETTGAVPALMPLLDVDSPLFWPVIALNNDAEAMALQALYKSVRKQTPSPATHTTRMALIDAVFDAEDKTKFAFDSAYRSGALLYAWRGSKALVQALPASLNGGAA